MSYKLPESVRLVTLVSTIGFESDVVVGLKVIMVPSADFIIK